MKQNNPDHSRRNFLKIGGTATLASLFTPSFLLSKVFATEPASGSIPSTAYSSMGILTGLDIGTSKVCAVVAKRVGVDGLRILAVGQAPSQGVLGSTIIDFDAASNCVQTAIRDAEAQSGVLIKPVNLAILGEHIFSFNKRLEMRLPKGRNEISDEDVEELLKKRLNIKFPNSGDQCFLHTIPQGYFIDGKGRTLEPAGLKGREISGDFHFITGGYSQVRNSIHSVKNLGIEVKNVVFGPLASASAVLNTEQKNNGALVIDIGASTVGHTLYANGLVWDSGCNVYRGDLTGSLPEVLQTLKRRIKKTSLTPSSSSLSVHLTGGGSRISGITELVESLFALPTRIAQAQGFLGPDRIINNPAFSCALGLARLDLERIIQLEEFFA